MVHARPISLLLVLCLGLATVGFGMARGQAPVDGQMVICTGHGAVTVSVDAEGNPITAHTLCPDAALAFLAAVASDTPEARPTGVSLSQVSWPQITPAIRMRSRPTRFARAPPVWGRAG